ncbi:hypothetical protein QO199_23295 [Serratia bockelmannii]|uniref:Uncharacterized protein n=1 Tax=Serratia bockelmannii TaxID=2703793 RepID=A0ABT8LWB2_9GAMM|nr:hypothetical protein [Serratia bockelmannii]MDN6881570.1 hypothetical protein [Serratia bockelmannii]HBH6890256.1 hypothetical protein [Serratia marcescens]
MAQSIKKKYLTTLRIDERTAEQIKSMLAENPLYTQSHLVRGAIYALLKMKPEERENMLLEAARMEGA